MAMKKEMLSYDVALLLLRYGPSPVVGELAQQLGMSEERLLVDLDRMRDLPRKGSATKRRATGFSVEKFVSEHPEMAEMLITLDARYENRTFLPELRDVKRFLDKHGHTLRTVKSRQVAKRRVFEVLVGLEPRRVVDLAKEQFSGADSSLGMISDQILRR